MKKLLIFLMLSILISCTQDSDNSNKNSTGFEGNHGGQGGSLATFILKGDYLYVVDQFDLNVFNISNNGVPTLVNKVSIGFDIETLFGYKDYLYIGSRSGMYIYDIVNPEFPKKLSSVQHFTACDPVVANDTHAYVTLHSNTWCGNDINVLEIYDIQTITQPVLISTRNLISPKGLGLFGDYLIVCDDEIKIFDVKNPNESKLINSIDKTAFDVIIRGNLLIAIGDNGLHQFKLNDTGSGINFETLSSVTF